MTPKEIFTKFNGLKTDMEKWAWLMNNQDKGITVECDNDYTCISVEGFDEDSEGWDDDCCGDFDNYIGRENGVLELLGVVGIKSESA